MNNEKREKLDKLDRLGREQDERGRRRDAIAAATADLGRLRLRLLKLGVVNLDEFTARAKGRWDDEWRVWWEIDGAAFSEYEGAIYVEQKANEVYEWTLLDEDGNPTEWMREPPPWSSLN
jgi:hypothetical protein